MYTRNVHTMRKASVIPLYQPGDRITERPKLRGGYTREQSKEILQKNSFQRYGTIVSNVIKEDNKRNRRVVYCEVRWDHQKSSSLHAQHRLCPVEKLPELAEQFRQSMCSDINLI